MNRVDMKFAERLTVDFKKFVAIPPALATELLMCWWNFNFLSTITPKSLCEKFCVIGLSFKV